MLTRKKQVIGESDMANAQIAELTSRKPLRLWPGVFAAALVLLGMYVVPIFVPEAMLFGMIGGLVGVLAIVVWWVFFSRVPWSERLGAVGLMIAALAATPLLLDKSVAKGNMGFQFFIHAIPFLSLAFVVWAVASRHLSNRLRRVSMVATILLACGVWTLVRSRGITSDGAAEFEWRWAETHEQRLLVRVGDEPFESAQGKPAVEATEKPLVAQARHEPLDSTQGRPVTPATTKISEKRLAAQASEAPAESSSTSAEMKAGAEWPGFRGPDRDGIVSGVRIETNWSVSPPVELWRRPVGPGVSSFAVHGDRFYTQEQRGDDEIVACYKVNTGEPVWTHSDTVRFWDAHVGAGPRATPTFSGGRVYTLGASGILNALNADNGAVVWSRNAAPDTSAKPPIWGFVSSPLVVDDIVIVQARGLFAYDLASGDQRWTAPAGGGSYSSPHLLTINGIAQILLQSHVGTISVAPTEGTLLWENPWPGVGIVQPALTSDGDLLVSMIDASAFPIGTRRLAVAHGSGGWTVKERWTSTGLKPSFSSFVVHKGHAFGFDGSILACIDVSDGKRKWKGGRYGQGQLILLPNQDLLLVLSEQGELALVKATPDQFTELGRFPALKGKTWNQPALVRDVLLVRNGQEMAAFRLSLVRN